MTAMSDVTVLLLTFFMLTSTFIQKEPVTVTTPGSVSEIKIPESDILQILVDPQGKVFMTLDKQEDRVEVLKKVGEEYGITFTPEEINKFRLANSFGVPISQMKAFLALSEDEQDATLKELGIPTCPVNWPIGSGKAFKGVYDRQKKEVELFSDTRKGTATGEVKVVAMNNPEIDWLIGDEAKTTLMEEIELLDGASAEFDRELVDKGELSPVFFGSALTNFGVETFLRHFLSMTTSPLPRMSDHGAIDPMKEKEFSAFVFKIQANMNKAHRDRIAFMRICSGEFDAGMNVYHVQGKKDVRLPQPQQMIASERKIIDKAYGGDIIGVFDPGIFSIGDTLTTSKEKFAYEGIPTFAPEHFARVRQVDTMKRKQFVKGINQIAQEGAIQIFQEYNTGMEEIIVGVVGVLQFDVLKYRLKNEYNVEILLENLPYEYIRWIESADTDLDRISGTSDMKKIKDLKDRPLLLFIHEWSIRMTLERNDGLVLSEFGRS